MKDKISEILMELCFLEREPERDSALAGDLGLDSLEMVELMIALEDAFGVELEESDLDPAGLERVEDLYRLMSRYGEVAPDAV